MDVRKALSLVGINWSKPRLTPELVRLGTQKMALMTEASLEMVLWIVATTTTANLIRKSQIPGKILKKFCIQSSIIINYFVIKKPLASNFSSN
jgi:hypothetical protein